MPAIRVRPVQRYSEVFGLGAEGQSFVVEVDFHLTFSFFVVKVECCQLRFVVLSFSFQVWRYSPTVTMSLLSTPFTACQSPSACMIARSSAYRDILETVVGMSEMKMLKGRGARVDPCGTPFLRRRKLLLLLFLVVKINSDCQPSPCSSGLCVY